MIWLECEANVAVDVSSGWTLPDGLSELLSHDHKAAPQSQTDAVHMVSPQREGLPLLAAQRASPAMLGPAAWVMTSDLIFCALETADDTAPCGGVKSCH